MHVPVPMLAILVLLATPTAILAALGFRDWARAHTLCFLGCADSYREDNTCVERFCLLYVPLWTRRGFHTTALFD